MQLPVSRSLLEVPPSSPSVSGVGPHMCALGTALIIVGVALAAICPRQSRRPPTG